MELIKKLERKIPNDKLYLFRLGLWTLFHTIIYYLITQLLITFNVSNLWLTLIIFGVLTTIASTIILKIGYNRRIDIDEEFGYFAVVHVVAIFMMNAIIIPTIVLPAVFLRFVFTGFGIAFLARVAKRHIMRRVIWLTLITIIFISLPLPKEISSFSPYILIVLIIAIIGSFVWPSIGGHGHHRHHHTFSLPSIPWWLIVIIIVVIAIFVKVPYAERSLPQTGGLFCENGKVMEYTGGFMNINAMASSVSKMGASLTCIDYKSSQCNLSCKNEKVQCTCVANVWDLVLHTPGDWIFD